jgi:hypothetical protein
MVVPIPGGRSNSCRGGVRRGSFKANYNKEVISGKSKYKVVSKLKKGTTTTTTKEICAPSKAKFRQANSVLDHGRKSLSHSE